MTSMRAATIWVAMATAAQAQYYPPRPSEPVVRMGPPMAIEDADDPDIYAPPPPPTYLRRQLERSEEHTSELQSLAYLVCRLLLEKKKKKKKNKKKQKQKIKKKKKNKKKQKK